jgi:tetratricopeptide (TPR) repeat protein
VRHIRASFEYVDPLQLPRLHERIGDLTAGDTGLDEYRLALEQYQAAGAPADDQLSALSGMLMVVTRWQGSVGGRPSEEWMADLRARGRALMERAQNQHAIGRFLAADAFFPFWIQSQRKLTDEEVASSSSDAERALQIAGELDDPDLASAALDAIGGSATAVDDWLKARETAQRRLEFEERLGFYERLDAHSMVAWMSYLMGDLAKAERDSAEMFARILPGQAPYPALHLYAWRALTLYMLGRWDEAVIVFWRAIEAWRDAGMHAAGYGLRGFGVGFDIGQARSDARLIAAATDAVESVAVRFPEAHLNRAWLAYVKGDPQLAAGFPERAEGSLEGVERRLNLASDRRLELPASVLDVGIDRALSTRVPLLEAQVWRARALAHRSADEMRRAIGIAESTGAVPTLGRARAELGLITGDAQETEAGLVILRKLGDANYVDRFRPEL